MAEALIVGLAKIYEVVVVGRDSNKLSHYLEMGFAIEHIERFDMSDKNIILAIKPYALEKITLKGKAQTLYSILAGTSIEKLKNKIKANAYVRVMPNLGAKYQASMSSLCGDESQKQNAIDIFSTIGRVIWLNSEKELNIATAVAGSGPAFIALIAEAISDGAVREGLTRDKANELTKGLFFSMNALLDNSHPAILKDEVMSPAGTTAEGVYRLEREGVRGALMHAIVDTSRRAND
jgi:pyrroline-5-carboxylate reductase